jgi:predicted phosphodiesterase
MKRILCVSDIHPGSIYGMLPPDFVASTGQPVPQSRVQKYLWECWLDMIAWATRKKLHAVIVVGDVVEGKQPKSHASELCLPLVADQEEASRRILGELIRAARCKLFIVKGTFYHDDELGRSVDNVARALRATAYEGLGTGYLAREVLDLNVGGVIVDVSHGISISTGLYRAVAIDREALWSAIAGKTGKAIKADVLVRGHAHYFVHVEHPSKHALILPAWQVQTSYMRRHSRYRMIPDLGAALLEIDPAAKRKGGDPCAVRKRIYDLPAHPVTNL